MCTAFEKCVGCPYPSHGFVCWGADGECMRTRIKKSMKGKTMQAILNNVKRPEYGSVTIPLPIPRAEYDHVMQMLENMGIGDPVRSDCWVLELSDEFPVLKRLECEAVNIDELDYLVKRLDSFITVWPCSGYGRSKAAF